MALNTDLIEANTTYHTIQRTKLEIKYIEGKKKKCIRVMKGKYCKEKQPKVAMTTRAVVKK